MDDSADFDGLKIRFFGLVGNILQQRGTEAVLIPGRDIAQTAMEGKIDATGFSMPLIDIYYDSQSVFKYHDAPAWHNEHPFQLYLSTKRLE